MTTIYCATNGEIVCAYTTSDNFPLVGQPDPSEWKHICRIAHDSDIEKAEIMATLTLKYSLQNREIKETNWPTIEDWKAEQKEFEGYKISTIRGNDMVVACTLAKVANEL